MPSRLSQLFLTTFALLPEIRALNYATVPSPDLDLSSLGRIALAGNWDSISLYNYIGQGEGTVNTNGSQSVLGRYPSGAFFDLQSTDAYVKTMCSWVRSNGTLGGVIVGGNFTDLGGQSAQGMALYDPTNNTVTPLPGLTGQVNSVYCDNENQVVYVGGQFSGGNSTNAIAWNIGEWANLPFLGFNGPVNSITKLPNGNIAFGGEFSGTGVEVRPTTLDAQAINVGSANISATRSSANADFSNPRNIICKTSNQVGPGNEWLLPDQTTGMWQAEFDFVFRPSKLRLYNSQAADHATKTWRFVTDNNSAIMNFTYNNAQGQLESCSAFCPLAQNASYQDFYFVNQIQMNSFAVDILEWYGSGGGLGGIELFQDEIYSYAVESFNEPTCGTASTTASSVTTTGPWTVHPSMDSASSYLIAQISTNSDLSVVFYPDIKQSGNYSVTIDTPGCLADNTCAVRGHISLTGQMASAFGTPTEQISLELWQTNNYDKYDQVYYGYVDVTDASFRPSITLTPTAGQPGDIEIVAQRVNFNLISSTSGLNGLFEFNPAANNNTDFTTSVVDQSGTQLGRGASISDMIVVDGITYVAGSFETDTYSSVFAISNGGSTSLPSGGLNGAINGLYSNSTHLFTVGEFTNTRNGSITGLNNIAAYSIASESWSSVGAGVNGVVESAIPISMNTSSGPPLDCIAFSGYFNEINAYGSSSSSPVNNIALWVPSSNDWLNNLNIATISVTGQISAYTNVTTGFGPLYAGAVNSQALGISGTAALAQQGQLTLEQLPINIQPSTQAPTSAVGKRAVERQVIDGCVTGTFYEQNGLNITMLAGHFTATATNGSEIANLAFINGTANNTVTGITSARLPADAVVLALDTSGTTLVAGGSDTDGIIIYDLATANLGAIQPPALTGGNSALWSVNAIAAQPSSSAVYVGGSFSLAGSLPCPALCVWNVQAQQWTAPPSSSTSSSLTNTSVITTMTWASPTKLILAGNMTFGSYSAPENYTTLTAYDTTSGIYTLFPNAGNGEQVPGQVSAFTPVDSSYEALYAAGTSNSNSSAFLAYFDSKNNNWTSITGLSPESVVYGLQTLTTMTDHAESAVMSQGQVLLASGSLQIEGFGNVSAALFNGTTWTPFILSTLTSGSPGSVRRTFVQNPSGFLTPSTRGNGSHLAVGYVVLISLAIALALVFLMIVAGIFLEKWRRKREGYVPMVPLNEKGGMSEKRSSRPPQLPPISKEATSGFGGGILGR